MAASHHNISHKVLSTFIMSAEFRARELIFGVDLKGRINHGMASVGIRSLFNK